VASPSAVWGISNMPMGAGDIAVEGSRAYASVWPFLRIIDVSDPSNVRSIGSYEAPEGVGWVAVGGDLVCMSGGDGILRLVDVTDPASPLLVGTYGPVWDVMGIAMSGSLLLVAERQAGLRVIDIADPASPTLAGHYDTPGDAWDVKVTGNLALVADGPAGLAIAKLPLPVPVASQCPANMVIPGYSTVPSVSLVGFRITNAGAAPAALSYWVSADGPASLVDKGDPASLAGVTPLLNPGASYYPPEAGLVIPDIRTHTTQRITYLVEDCAASCETAVTFEPPVPVLINSFEARACDEGVRLRWDVYSDESVMGYRIYRGLDPGPISGAINGEQVIPPAARTYVDGDVHRGRTYQYLLVVVLADGNEAASQRVVVKTTSYILALDQNVPNPFNPNTTISFTLPDRGHVTLAIYDVEGMCVKTLVDEHLGGGRHQRQWDGRMSNGVHASSGLYFCRLEASGRALTRKLMLLK